jgi:hypothetical protein
MMRQRDRLFGSLGAAWVVAALGAAACGDNPASPTSPTPASTYVVTGLVTERTANGPVPVEGVVVRFSQGNASAITDSDGAYAISAPGGFVFMTFSKDGYVSRTTPVAPSADTRVDVELVRVRPSAYTISGIVYERTPSGNVPVDGVRVEDIYRHLVTVTDRDGRYSVVISPKEFSEFDGFMQLYLTKDGFQAQTKGVVINFDDAETRLDIEIVRQSH